MRTLSAVLAACALTASAHGALYSSWENDLEGWSFTNAVPPATSFSSTAGVTEGSYSLQVDLPASDHGWDLFQFRHGAFGSIGNGLNLAEGRTTIVVDVTTNATNVFVGFLVQGGRAGDPSTFNSGPVGFVDCSSPDGTYKTTTISYDFSAHYPPEGAAGWEEYRIIFRGDNSSAPTEPRTVYLDNFQIVPEPTSLGLLATGAMLALRRRRA